MDSPPISPYIELRNAEKDLQLTERRLAKKRKDLISRKDVLDTQWFELSQREKALRDNFIIFSKFLKTNLEKRERAMKKIQTDTENVQNRTAEINLLREKYNVKLQEFRLMRQEIQKHSIYPAFLEEVMDLVSGEFKDIEDLPKRMEVLLIAREKLTKHQAELLNSLECSKRVMGQFMESKILQIIGLNNTIACLQYAHDDAINRTIELDNMVVNLKTTILKYATDLTANKAAIKNLYSQMCSKQKVVEKHRHKNVINQLAEVNQAMKDYAKIISLMRRRSRRESRLSRKIQ
ncbi:coiled-coil domain-containing protein 42 like-2-like isoform X2 [Coccinella septempunctata]|nr:coiled-coil domain-containing protein 42 like-2-like isoform X2 [Coccinella septempunctata]